MVEAIKNLQAPDRKVNVGAINGAIMAIIAWAVGEFAGIKIPPEIAIAGSTVIGFVLAYLIPNK
jgi:putative flippase GtrA